MGTSALSDEESFLFQSQALAECLVRLGNMEASEDPKFECLKNEIYGQSAKVIKEGDETAPIFRGQGVLLTMFYLLLVFPHELIDKGKLEEGYNMSNAEDAASSFMLNHSSTYTNPKPILTHFRNALSHGRIGWSENRLIIEDEYTRKNQKQEFRAEFAMDGLGEILQELNQAFAAYVGDVIKVRQ